MKSLIIKITIKIRFIIIKVNYNSVGDDSNYSVVKKNYNDNITNINDN